MNIESFRDYCLSFSGVSEEFPFDKNTLVFKVMGKMFALCNVDNFESINLKCDPIKVIALREEFPDLVLPGYHMSKKHWNTVSMKGRLPDNLIKDWIKDSYDLVVAKLPERERERLKRLG